MIVVEFVKDDVAHVNCNATILAVLLIKYPNETLHFFCGQKHFDNIIKELKSHNIDSKNIVHHKINPISKIAREYSYIGFQFKIVKNIFNFAKENNEKKIYFLLTLTFFLFFLKLFCFLNKDIKVHTIIHQELEKIDMKEYLSHTVKNKVLTFLYVFFFGIQNPLKLPTPKNLKYMVYGDSIRNNAIKILKNIESSLISIPTPYIYSTISKTKRNIINKPINLGIVGVCGKHKNSDMVYNFIDNINKLNTNSFKVIFSGKITDIDLYKKLQEYDFVERKSLSTEMISIELRNEMLKEMDYAVLLNNVGSYKYTSSGALSDAIDNEKPIIALTNDYIEEYIRKYGNIGYTFNSIEELNSKIKSLSESFPIEEYYEQINNIRKIKEIENIQNVAEILKDF